MVPRAPLLSNILSHALVTRKQQFALERITGDTENAKQQRLQTF